MDTFFPFGVSALKSSNIILYPIYNKGVYTKKKHENKILL